MSSTFCPEKTPRFLENPEETRESATHLQGKEHLFLCSAQEKEEPFLLHCSKRDHRSHSLLSPQSFLRRIGKINLLGSKKERKQKEVCYWEKKPILHDSIGDIIPDRPIERFQDFTIEDLSFFKNNRDTEKKRSTALKNTLPSKKNNPLEHKKKEEKDLISFDDDDNSLFLSQNTLFSKKNNPLENKEKEERTEKNPYLSSDILKQKKHREKVEEHISGLEKLSRELENKIQML